VGKFVGADGGTIFLDEIGDMSMKTQAKVLRALQDGEVEPVGAAKVVTVDVRVIAATNKSLGDEITEGRFREDLYFRLNVVPIEIPPLRERPLDIEPLVHHFIDCFCRENNYKKKTVSPEAMQALRQAPWRGNVRELRNAVERILIMSPGETIEVDNLPAGLGQALGAGATTPVAEGSLLLAAAGRTLQQFKDNAERSFLVMRLREHEWNVAATAKSIETPRSNLYKKLDAYGITRDTDGQS
jgi:two-component system nitrogen regulation response regulator NtrX